MYTEFFNSLLHFLWDIIYSKFSFQSVFFFGDLTFVDQYLASGPV
jgi:hypothetical protein